MTHLLLSSLRPRPPGSTDTQECPACCPACSLMHKYDSRGPSLCHLRGSLRHGHGNAAGPAKFVGFLEAQELLIGPIHTVTQDGPIYIAAQEQVQESGRALAAPLKPHIFHPMVSPEQLEGLLTLLEEYVQILSKARWPDLTASVPAQVGLVAPGDTSVPSRRFVREQQERLSVAPLQWDAHPCS